jgi:hypothetical protein
VAYVFTVADGRIITISRIANEERLRELEPVILDG